MISSVLRQIAENKAALVESLRGHEVPPPLSAAMKDVDSAAAREQFSSNQWRIKTFVGPRHPALSWAPSKPTTRFSS